MPTQREIILGLPLGPPRTFSDGTIVGQEHEDEALATKKRAMENGLNYANNTLIAVTAHRRGDLAPTPCDRCKDGSKSQKFKECVVVKGTMGGKCTSCYVGRNVKYLCLWDGVEHDAGGNPKEPKSIVQPKSDDMVSPTKKEVPEAKNSSRIEIWIGQVERKFNELLNSAQARFVAAHPDLTKPAYWEWIFNVSSPHSPRDWPPIYVTAKQRTPQIDDWDTTKIRTLLRLTEDGMLWVRGLTGLDYDVSQSQLRAFKTIEGETLPREVTMRDTLIQTIESRIGRPIQPRDHKAIDPCVSDKRTPNLYEWQFSWKYPAFPEARGGVSRWTIAEVEDCKAALEVGHLSIGIVEPSNSDDDEPSTAAQVSPPAASFDQPLEVKESVEKKTSPPVPTSLETMVSGITNHLSTSMNRSASFAEMQSMIFQSLMQKAVDEESKSVAEAHLLEVAKLQGQLEHVERHLVQWKKRSEDSEATGMDLQSQLEDAKQQSTEWKKRYENSDISGLDLRSQRDIIERQSIEWKKKSEDNEVTILELQTRIRNLETQSAEKARSLDKIITKAREEGEIIGKDKAVKEMDLSLNGERQAFRLHHLDRVEEVRKEAYQQGLEAGRSGTNTGDLAQTPTTKLEPVDVQDVVAHFPEHPSPHHSPAQLAQESVQSVQEKIHDAPRQPTSDQAIRSKGLHSPVPSVQQKVPPKRTFEDLRLHGDDLANPKRNRALRAIFRAWHDIPNGALPTSMLPSGACLSNFTLSQLASLSKTLPLHEATSELKAEITRRNQHSSRQARNPILTTADVAAVLSHHGITIPDPKTEPRPDQNERSATIQTFGGNQPPTGPRNHNPEGLRSPSYSPHLGNPKRSRAADEEPRERNNKRRKSIYEPDLYPAREFIPSRR